jgi:hypothetical protein
MSCASVNTLAQATEKLSSSVLPIDGLRRDSDGNLTKDAMLTIVDGLKSRGVNPTDEATKNKILKDLSVFLCSLNNQYQFLLTDLTDRVQKNQVVPVEYINTIKDKNITMQDVLNTSGYLSGISTVKDGEFIEGWQNTVSDPKPNVRQVIEGLQSDMGMLDSKSYLELKKQMVDVSEQKNRVASNYLGLYGFLNLVAVGLLIYVAAAPK